ncbi:50S ribosomal protein L32 [Streptomyces roseoverticillatus]
MPCPRFRLGRRRSHHKANAPTTVPCTHCG